MKLVELWKILDSLLANYGDSKIIVSAYFEMMESYNSNNAKSVSIEIDEKTVTISG